ncbi:MAG TPA: hypothetical protein PLG31_04415 [Spirochaetota bacterium]|nr:hypothetical protein [Spirochaetota bacterium]
MEYVFYAIGLLVGVLAFLYMVSLYEAGKSKVREIITPDRERGANAVQINPSAVTVNNAVGRHPGERICPLCGSVLTKYEALYATFIDTEGDRRLLIHGCRYCHRPDEKPEEKKKSDL